MAIQNNYFYLYGSLQIHFYIRTEHNWCVCWSSIYCAILLLSFQVTYKVP